MAKRKSEEQILRENFKRVFGSEGGAEVLAHLRSHCFMDHHGFVAGEPETCHFNWGKHAVYTYIESLLRDIPEKQQEVAIDE